MWFQIFFSMSRLSCKTPTFTRVTWKMLKIFQPHFIPLTSGYLDKQRETCEWKWTVKKFMKVNTRKMKATIYKLRKGHLWWCWYERNFLLLFFTSPTFILSIRAIYRRIFKFSLTNRHLSIFPFIKRLT
jgi:hypothetical protein